MEVIQWRIKDKSVHIPVAIAQYKMEIHFAVINAANKHKMLANPANAAIRAVEIINRSATRDLRFFLVSQV
jgi:hypothetical protein